MRSFVAAAVVAALLLVGCGTERDQGRGSPESPASSSTTDSSEGVTPSGSPVVMRDGELVVSCGAAPGWPLSVMPEGLPGVLSRPEVVAIFEDLLANPAYAEELRLSFLADGAEGTEARVLVATDDTYTFGLGTWTADGPGHGAMVMSVQRSSQGWAFAGGGDCLLKPELVPGHTWAFLSPPASGLDRTTRSPTVGVTERECTSGRDPRPHLHEPYVVEAPESVTVYWTSTPVEGYANCIGNPSTEVTLDLTEPLGDRALLDGSTYPPAPIGGKVAG